MMTLARVTENGCSRHRAFAFVKKDPLCCDRCCCRGPDCACGGFCRARGRAWERSGILDSAVRKVVLNVRLWRPAARQLRQAVNTDALIIVGGPFSSYHTVVEYCKLYGKMEARESVVSEAYRSHMTSALLEPRYCTFRHATSTSLKHHDAVLVRLCWSCTGAALYHDVWAICTFPGKQRLSSTRHRMAV